MSSKGVDHLGALDVIGEGEGGAVGCRRRPPDVGVKDGGPPFGMIPGSEVAAGKDLIEEVQDVGGI